MTSLVRAFCPGHISGYFRPVLTGDPSSSGSCGGGIVIDSGVEVTVTHSKTSEIRIYREESGRKTLQSDTSRVISRLLSLMNVNASVETRCQLPLSSGYGLSAASLLATAHAVNTLYELNLSDLSCTHLAHEVEVREQTGLGDVAACQMGGWVYRNSPGPGGEIIRSDDNRPVYAVTLGPLRTSSVLSSPSMMERIHQAYPLGRPCSLEELFAYSLMFARRSGLMPEDVEKVLIECEANDIPASMTMLGNGIFALGDKAKTVLSPYGTVYSLHVAKQGPRILEVVR